MKEILEIMIQNLVVEKQAISVTETQKEDSIHFEVKVSQKDMGKVIGKQGRIAQAIRTVMKAVGMKENKKVTIEFIG